MASVTFDGRSFQIDGRRVWIVGGSIQHGRIPNELWADRLHAARLAGLNTVETSVLWNAVEPRPGHFDFSGSQDIRAFVQLAREMGLHVILRVGPFTGRGWDMGGLPVWLLSQEGVRLRASNAPFLEAVSRYFSAVAEQVRDLQLTATGAGGALLAVQVEHEWTCGEDGAGAYLGDLGRYLREAGITVPAINANNLWQGAEGQIDAWVGDSGMYALVRQLGFVRPGQPRLIIEFGDGRWPRIGEEAPERADQYDLQRRLAEALASGGQYCVSPFCAPSVPGFWGGMAASGHHRFGADASLIDAPVTETGVPTPSFGPVRRLSTFAMRFARVLAAFDPEYRPVVQAPAMAKSGPIVTHLDGAQGSVAFVYSPESGMRGHAIDLLRPNGSSLRVHLGRQRVSWFLFDVHLGGHATLDYCGLNVFDAVGELLVCFGPAGTVGMVSINGTPMEIDVPKGRKPSVERLEGVTVVVVSEDMIDETFIANGMVYVGVESVTRHGSPVPHGKQWTRVTSDGETKTVSGSKGDSIPRVSLGAWEAASTEEHATGSSPRYAGIDGPKDLAELGTPRGYGWYRIELKSGATKKTRLAAPQSADRVHVLLDGTPQGVLGEGPGASPDVSVSLKRGSHTLVVLADNMGRCWEGASPDERKGVFGQLYEVAPIKTPKPEIVESTPISPLGHESPLMLMRANDATLPERVTWKVMHRRKSPLHITLGPSPARGALLVNDRYISLVEHGGVIGLMLEEERLNRGHNTIEFAPLESPEPDSSMAKLASALSSVLEVRECASDLTGKAEWAFAKWEPPSDAQFDVVPKTKVGEQAGPVWWRCEFELSGLSARALRLDLGGMTKGQVYVNGHNAGRYFKATADGTAVPPAGEMWLPGPWLREGANELMLFDEHGGNPSKVKLAFDSGARPIAADGDGSGDS
ncbi:MAG: beta-galactosidase [Phycisphaeraceae bacterium]|nr:MAG: beta-galactosidase [Phycisphaeraceae bacterium]